MTVDLTGGLPDWREYGFEEYPDTPDMRDSVNFWLCDDQGRFGMPRCTMEAIGPDWQNDRQAMINISFPDGRVYTRRDYKCQGPASNKGADGKATVFSAGPIEFRLIEPYVKWTASFEGECAAVTSLEQMNGLQGGQGDRHEMVSLDVEMNSAVPPWVPTSHLEPGLKKILTEEELVYTHEWGPCHRQEQLFRCSGRLRIGDDETYAFTGTGLRIRRQNIFRTSTFTGHVWQSALFPSGKAFGCNTYAPRLDGKPSYSEGWIFDGKQVLPARVIRVPWLTRLSPSGDDASIILETSRGFHHIGGETFASTFEPNVSLGLEKFAPYLQQAAVRYTWDGEETFGMMERSTLREKLFAGKLV
jgi:hypothetical protein